MASLDDTSPTNEQTIERLIASLILKVAKQSIDAAMGNEEFQEKMASELQQAGKETIEKIEDYYREQAREKIERARPTNEGMMCYPAIKQYEANLLRELGLEGNS